MALNSRLLSVAFAAGAACLLLQGCGGLTQPIRSSPPAPTQARDPDDPFPPAGSPESEHWPHPGPPPPIGKLTQLPNGPGILVCEPVVREADAGAAQFGAGCGRWLHFIVGLEAKFGKTPLWSHIDAAARQLGHRDLRLTLGEARRVAGSLGITHVAVGEIRGAATRCTLTYRLYALRPEAVIGAPIAASGTGQAVITQLPDLARQICARLGAKSARIPKRAAESAGDLRLLGRVPWELQVDRQVSQRDVQELESVAGRSALAGLLLVTYYGAREDGKRVRALSENLIGSNPYNPLLLAEISRQAYASKSIWIPRMCEPQLSVLANSAHDNFQVAVAANYQQRITGNLDYAQRAGEQAVRCSTRNPEAWLVMGGTYANEADLLREMRRRKGGDQPPSAAEREANERWMELVRHATEVDPHCENAWYWLVQVAERLGRMALAEQAYWRCVALARDMPGIYSWGLRRYRSPQYQDRTKLVRIAAMAAAASAEWPPEQRVRVALAVVRAGLPEMALRVVRTDVERAELLARLRRLSQPLSEPSA